MSFLLPGHQFLPIAAQDLPFVSVSGYLEKRRKGKPKRVIEIMLSVFIVVAVILFLEANDSLILENIERI